MKPESLVYDPTNQLMNKMMELSMERQKVIASNVANAETPGYVRRELEFTKKLAEVIESGTVSDLKTVKGEMVKDLEGGTMQRNGNNVVLTDELNNMMQNSIFYNLLSKAFSTKMRILNNAIK